MQALLRVMASHSESTALPNAGLASGSCICTALCAAFLGVLVAELAGGGAQISAA